MLDDYRQLLVFVYCCMLIVSHKTQGATDGPHQRPTPTHPEVATLHPPRPASRPRRGPGTIMIASGYTITCLPTIIKYLVFCI